MLNDGITAVVSMSKEAIDFHSAAVEPETWQLRSGGVEKLRTDVREEAVRCNVRGSDWSAITASRRDDVAALLRALFAAATYADRLARRQYARRNPSTRHHQWPFLRVRR